MFRIKVREANGKWQTIDRIPESAKEEALKAYNDAPVPKMLIANAGVVHKQYSDNGFIYIGRK